MGITIDASGLVREKRDSIEKELEIHFRQFTDIEQIALIQIVISSDFEKAVGELLREKLRVKLEYKAARTEVRAFGKTIPYPIDNRLGITIVFDGAFSVLWEPEARSRRLLLYSHESGHIIQTVALFNDVGKQAFTEPTTIEGIFFNLAHDIWSEYYADRSSLEGFETALREAQPNATAIYPHRYYADSFIALLKELPKYVMQNVTDFRNSIMTMDQFWPRMYSRLRETLIVAALAAAYSDAIGKTHPEVDELTHKHAYSFFLEPWKHIQSDMRELYSLESKYDRLILNRMAIELLVLFRNCGMEISNVSNGIYVSVKSVDLV